MPGTQRGEFIYIDSSFFPSHRCVPSSSLYILLLQMLSSFQKADTQPSFKPNVLTTMTFIVG